MIDYKIGYTSSLSSFSWYRHSDGFFDRRDAVLDSCGQVGRVMLNNTKLTCEFVSVIDQVFALPSTSMVIAKRAPDPMSPSVPHS